MDEHKKAHAQAFRALNARERTAHELQVFLERRGIELDVISDVVADLAAEGLVDDAGYARRFTEDRRLLDQWGSERIARDLARRGIERDLIDVALLGVERADEVTMAVELLDRRYRQSFTGDRDRDKAWRMLVRRGYDSEIAYEAVRRHERGVDQAA